MPTHKPLVDTRRKSPELRHAARSSGGGGQRSVPAAAALAGAKMLTGYCRLLLPGSKPLPHLAEVATWPIKAAAFGIDL